MEKEKNRKESNLSTIQRIEKIVGRMAKSRLTETRMMAISDQARHIASLLGCTERQAILFSVMLGLNLQREDVDIEDLSDFFDCTPIRVIKFMEDFEQLIRLKLMKKEICGHRRRKSKQRFSNVKFYIPLQVMNYVLTGKKEQLAGNEQEDIYAVLEHISEIIENHHDEQINFEEMMEEFSRTLRRNKHLPAIRKMNSLHLQPEDQLIFLFVSAQYILNNEEEVDLADAVNKIIPGRREQLEVRRGLVQGSHRLVRHELVQLESDIFGNDRSITLTDQGLDLILSNEKELFIQKKNDAMPGMIPSASIIEKPLHFEPSIREKIDFLTNLLQPRNFNQLRERMEDQQLKTGFAALFHGFSGTGKTEAVYQVARATGRDIRQVIISETKSMWFGQSEKLVKAVFDDYRKLAEKSKIMPILLFNEADGVFGARKQNGRSAVDQTENAIQNILLQEMEDLNGIMIATTNLTENLDKAFERRFLFKIRFEKPTIEARCMIWMDKIHGISKDQAETLSRNFDLSGGQIDNISRKLMMYQVLHNIPGWDLLESFCAEESLDKPAGQNLGFRIPVPERKRK